MTIAEFQPKQSNLFARILRNPGTAIPLAVFVAIALLGVFAPLIAPFDPAKAALLDLMQPPSATHIMGTDAVGRDIWSRWLFATQNSLATAALGVAVAAVLGVTFGLIAGYFRGWIDQITSWITSLTMSLPALVVLMTSATVLGPSTWVAMAVLGLIMSTGYFRLVYTTVSAVRNELYIDAAKVAGLSNARVITNHVLGVVRAPIIIHTSIVAAIAVSVQGGLQVLGLGDPGVPSWGSMLNDAFQKMYTAPILLIWPAMAIAITCLALVLFASGLRDLLEVSTSSVSSATKDIYDQVLEISAGVVQSNVNGNPLLEITDLSVGYPTRSSDMNTVVRNVSLQVNRGQIVGLVGESGSGKTQTAFAALGLLPSSAQILGGTIIFDGVNLADKHGSRQIRGKRIAYIPQEPMSNLDPNFTIGAQLTEPLVKVLGLKPAKAKERAVGLLKRVGINNAEAVIKLYPHEISGGMAQRVLIAGAVASEPDLIIADEPTTALDVTIQAEVLDLIRELQSEANMGVLLVTHNFGVVADLCDFVYVMKQGEIVEAAPVLEVFSAAKHPYTKALLSAILDESTVREDYVPTAGVTA